MINVWYRWRIVLNSTYLCTVPIYISTFPVYSYTTVYVQYVCNLSLPPIYNHGYFHAICIYVSNGSIYIPLNKIYMYTNLSRYPPLLAVPCPATLRSSHRPERAKAAAADSWTGLYVQYSTNSHRQCINNAEIQRSCSSVKRCRTALFTSQSLLIHYAAMARDPIPPFPLLLLKCPGGAFRYWRPSLPVPGLSVLQDSAS